MRAPIGAALAANPSKCVGYGGAVSHPSRLKALLRSISASRRESSKDALNKSFDKLRMNGNLLIPFVVSLSNHERNRIIQSIPKCHGHPPGKA